MRRLVAVLVAIVLSVGASMLSAPPASAHCIQIVEGGGCVPCPDLDSRLVRVYCLM